MSIFDDLIPRSQPQRSIFADLIPQDEEAPRLPQMDTGVPTSGLGGPIEPTPERTSSVSRRDGRQPVTAGVEQLVSMPEPSFAGIAENPAGMGLTRAVGRGALRTASSLPTLAATADMAALSDSSRAKEEIAADTLRSTFNLEQIPEGVDLSSPEQASAFMRNLGYPAQLVNTFRQVYDKRIANADAARQAPDQYQSRITGNLQAAGGLIERANAIPMSPGAERMKRRLAADSSVSGTIKNMLSNPLEAFAFLGEVAGESAPQIAASAATSAITRNPTAGAMVMGAGAVGQEFGASTSEFLAEEGYDLSREGDIDRLLNDPETLRKASDRGMSRGLVIAMMESLGQGVAAQQLMRSEVGNAFAQTLVQAATGAGGEFAAQKAAGQEISGQEILLEGLAETITAPFEVGAAAASSRTPRGDIGGGDDDPERLNSPRLTPADRASPLPNDIIDDGKAALEALVDNPQPPQAGVQPLDEAAPNVRLPEVDAVQRPLPTDRLSPTLGAAPDADAAPSQPDTPQQPEAAPQRRLSEPMEDVATPGRMVQIDLDTGETVDVAEATAQPAPVADVPANPRLSEPMEDTQTGEAIQIDLETGETIPQRSADVTPQAVPEATDDAIPEVADPAPAVSVEPQRPTVARERLKRRPLTDLLKAEGVQPGSPLAVELSARGIDQRTTPGLFKAGGRTDWDNLPVSEWSEFAPIVGDDGNGYLSRDGLIEAVENEMRGQPVQVGEQARLQEARDLREYAARFDGDDTPPIDLSDVPEASIEIPVRNEDISTDAERRQMVERSVEGMAQSLGLTEVLTAAERREAANVLEANGGNVEDVVWGVVYRSVESGEDRNFTAPETDAQNGGVEVAPAREQGAERPVINGSAEGGNAPRNDDTGRADERETSAAESVTPELSPAMLKGLRRAAGSIGWPDTVSGAELFEASKQGWVYNSGNRNQNSTTSRYRLTEKGRKALEEAEGPVNTSDLPVAAEGLTSYRYQGNFGPVMIGAKDVDEALREAGRSIEGTPDRANLEVWDGDKYVAVDGAQELDPREEFAQAKAEFERLDAERQIENADAYFAASRRLSAARRGLADKLAEEGGRIELSNSMGNGATITPTGDGYQISYFDNRGFSGDTRHDTLQAAVRDAVGQGYDTEAPGLLKQKQKGEQWQSPAETERARREIEERTPEPATEQTDAGEQTLMPGVAPITERDRQRAEIERRQNSRMTGRDEGPGSGRDDLFGAPEDRRDLFDAAPEAADTPADMGKAAATAGDDRKPPADMSAEDTTAWLRAYDEQMAEQVLEAKRAALDEGGKPAADGSPVDVVEYKPTEASPTLQESVGTADASTPRDGKTVKYQRQPTAPLYVVHNLSEQKLKYAVDLGGLAAPSLAVARGDIGFDSFGEISLIAMPSMADPRQKGVRAFNADVYSPRQPRARFRVKERDASRVFKAMRAVAGDLGFDGQLDISDLEGQGASAISSNVAIKAAWLRSKGETIPVQYDAPPAAPTPIKGYDGFDGTDAQALWNDDAFVARVQKVKDDHIAQREGKMSPGLLANIKATLFDEDGKVNDDTVISAARAVANRNREIANFKPSGQGPVNQYQTLVEIDKAIEGRETEYSDWVRAEFGDVIGDAYFEDGRGRRRDYTMTNIVREMTRELRDAEGFNYGVGNVRANVATEFRTLAQVKDAREQITDSETMDRLKTEVGDEFFALADKFAPYHANGDSFGWGDIFSEFLKDMAKGPRGVQEWQSGIFSEPVPDELLAEAAAFLDKLKGLPTEYFEIKMQRAVDLSEFTAALVPENASPETIETLENAGLQVVRYNRDDGRTAALSDVTADVMFQRAQVASATKSAVWPNLPQLRAELDNIGLASVDLRKVAPDPDYQAALEIDANGGMTVLIGASLDPLASLRHEAIHALKAMNLFGKGEWKILETRAQRDWMAKHDIEARYPELSRLEQIEEAIAEEYAAWDGKTQNGAFAKIKKFLEALGNMLRGQGFQTVEDVFGNVTSGVVGRRPGRAVGQSTRMQEQPDTFAAEFLTELAAVDDLFSLPVAKSGDLETAISEVDPDLEYVGVMGAVDVAGKDGVERILVRDRNNSDIFIYRTDDEVWIDVSRLKEGGGGNAVYAAVGDYAANSGRVFIGDPDGLSDVAVRRRTDNMLSSALRHGSTNHLAPHQQQIDGDPSIGVPPLRWRDGDTFGNVQELIRVSTESLAFYVPEIRDFSYDFAAGAFRDAKGELLNASDVRERVAQLAGMREARAGRRTLQRGILFNALSRASSGEQSRLLERVLRQPGKLVSGGLSGIFYQRPNPNAQGREAIARGTNTPHIPDRQVFDEALRENATILARASGVKGAARDALDDARIAIQDRMLPLRRAEEAIAELTGGVIDKKDSAYFAEERYSGRVGFRLDAIRNEYVNPIARMIGKAGDKLKLTDPKGKELTGADAVDLYLWARHAKERNARISTINPDFGGPTLEDPYATGTGSGMSDAQADAIIAQAEKSLQRKTFKDIGAMTDRLGQEMIQWREDAGLLSKEEAAIWRAMYTHYVPLRGFAETDMHDAVANEVQIGSGGSKYGARGKEAKRALGRSSESYSPLSTMLAMAEEVTVRAEKNLVARTLYNLAEKYPAPAMWRIKTPETKRYFNSATGTVETRIVDPASVMPKPNEVALKINGIEKRVELIDPSMADAMSQLGTMEMGAVTRFASMFSRLFSATNTMLSPPFIIVNAFRDMVTAQINLGQLPKELRGKVRKAAVRDWIKSFAGSYSDMRGGGESEYAQYFREFSAVGAKVSFWQIENPEARNDQLRKAIRRESGGMLNQMFWKNATFDTDVNPVLNWIETVNLAVDNATRLSVFVEARKQGMSVEEAASLSKNLTVNFNRRGEWGATMNAWFPFANAAVQGSHVLIKAMKAPQVQALLGGAVLTGFAMEFLNASLSEEDEDGELAHDKIPDYISQRNLIIPTGGESRVTIPLPYGYNVFFYAGQQMAKAMRGVKDEGQATRDVMKATFGAFSPISGEGLAQTLMPTLGDHMMELATNKDWLGRPIRPEAPFGDYGPQAYKMFKNEPPAPFQFASDMLNKGTGGNELEPGLIDVSPEYLHHTFKFLTGGAGRFVDQVTDIGIKVASGDADLVQAHQVPLLRTVRYQPSEFLDQGRYFEFRNSVNNARAMVEKRAPELGIDPRDELVKMAGLYPQLRAAERQRRAISEKIDDIYADRSLTYRERRERLEPLEKQRQDVYIRFNRAYVEAMGPQSE